MTVLAMPILDLLADLESGTMSQQAIADRPGLTKAAVSRHIAAARQRGWVHTGQSRTSRRENSVALTGRGERLSNGAAGSVPRPGAVPSKNSARPSCGAPRAHWNGSAYSWRPGSAANNPQAGWLIGSRCSGSACFPRPRNTSTRSEPGRASTQLDPGTAFARFFNGARRREASR